MNTVKVDGGRFNVVILKKGDAYGLTGSLIAKEPMVEFYDAKHAGPKFGPLGQFVTRYNATTIAEFDGGALALNFGVPAWTVSAAGMVEVVAAVRAEVK